MNVKAIIDFLIHHNVQIIEWLVASILILFAGLLGWNFFKKPKENTETEDLKKVLKEVLETTRSQTVVTSASSESKEASVASAKEAPVAVPAAPDASATKQIQELQSQIESLRNELAEAREAASAAAVGAEAGADPAELTQAKAKVKELEAKLAEYEILEDDIADITLYKEENERLKQQLASLGAEPSAAEEPLKPPMPEDIEFALPAEEKTQTPTQQSDEIVAEFEAAVKVTKDVATAPAASSPAREDLTNFSADDLMAEFERSMSEPGSVTQPDEKSKESEVIVAADAKVTNTETLVEETKENPAEDTAPPDTDHLDTEKMLAEMAALENLSTDAEGSGLEEEVDTEKMAAEASDLAAKG